MPFNQPSPKNLGLSRQVAVAVSIVSVVVALVTLVIAAQLGIVDNPTVIGFVATLGIVIPNLVSALKSSETADTAAQATQVARFTASQHATLLQMMASFLESQTKGDET